MIRTFVACYWWVKHYQDITKQSRPWDTSTLFMNEYFLFTKLDIGRKKKLSVLMQRSGLQQEQNLESKFMDVLIGLKWLNLLWHALLISVGRNGKMNSTLYRIWWKTPRSLLQRTLQRMFFFRIRDVCWATADGRKEVKWSSNDDVKLIERFV